MTKKIKVRNLRGFGGKAHWIELPEDTPITDTMDWPSLMLGIKQFIPKGHGVVEIQIAKKSDTGPK